MLPNKYLRDMRKKFYSKEFKDQAVSLSHQRDNIKELADELGIQVQLLYKWRKAARLSSSKKTSMKEKDDSSELKQLRKALKEKDQELAILKKAVHIFSKSDGRFTSL